MGRPKKAETKEAPFKIAEPKKLRLTSELQKKVYSELLTSSKGRVAAGESGSKKHKACLTLAKKYPELFEVELDEHTEKRLREGKATVAFWYDIILKAEV
jgi:uncharacterized protein Veg